MLEIMMRLLFNRRYKNVRFVFVPKTPYLDAACK